MVKTFMLNVANLNDDNDLNKIKSYYENDNGIISISAIFEANIISIKYDDGMVSHTSRFIDDLNNLGYTVK